jgi:ribosomal protein S4
MRFLNKYKLHENFASGLRKLPLRILKFKRPKWASIKKKFKIKRFVWKFNKRIWKKPRFINLLKIGIKKKFYMNKVFSIKLQTKKYISSLYDNSVKVTWDNKEKFRKNSICNVIAKPMYRVDILLWYLNFFSSAAASKQFINSKKAFVNNKVVGSNYILQQGDMLSFDLPDCIQSVNSYRTIKSKFSKNRHFFPYLEYDYYSNTFLVLKNWNQLTENDLTLMFKENRKVKYIK